MFLSIAPIYEGHVLVVPKIEGDKWYDHDQETLSALMKTAKFIAPILENVFDAHRVALLIEGLEVPHTHIHLIPLPHGTGLSGAKPTPTDNETLLLVKNRILEHMQ